MNFFRLIFVFLLLSCGDSEKSKHTAPSVKQYMSESERPGWHFNAPTDSTAGIGIQKALDFLKEKEPVEVIVAVIDGPVNINHEDLKNVIYRNANEIDGNLKDDDNNGYVDDIHGWNYVGKKDGSSLVYGFYESTRKLKKLIKAYSIQDLDDLTGVKDTIVLMELKALIKETQEAKESADRSIAWAERHRDNYYNFFKYYPEIVQSGDPYTNDQWDSITNTMENKEALEAIATWRFFKKYNHSITRHNTNITWHYAKKYIATNVLLHPEKNIDDDPDNFTYTGYGNSFVGSQRTLIIDDHGTLMAGIIGAEHNNGLGIRGVSPNVRIMPLEVFSNFMETTKDFANAVRYAADNGARVINYSNSRDEFITDSVVYYNAIKYALDKGVLFVCAASNKGEDNDLLWGRRHPMMKEGRTGFMKIGASGEHIDGGLVYKNSSYGKHTVDIFAPGTNVPTTENFEYKYKNSSGTSSATAVVSGLAALLWSYYPNLSSKDIEDIIKESGTSYDVDIKTKNGTKRFGKMSQTGKVVNAYNAVLLAEKKAKVQK